MKLYPLPEKVIKAHVGTLNQKVLDLSKPQVMGILNVTPDSFSDGGEFNKIDTALKHCEHMLNAGVDIIDIGGESTRPNAKPVSEIEECERVVPIVEAIRKNFGNEIWLSIDTSTPVVMQESVQAGADIWNDVRALKREFAPAMAAKLDIPVVLMHMRGEPKTMGEMAHYDDVVEEVISELKNRVDIAIEAGVSRNNIIIDPGFGFAKSYNHHTQLLNHLSELHKLDLPILFGISRKRFLGEVLDNTNIKEFQNHMAKDRDGVGMAAALLAVQQGASIIRTHNVQLTKQGLALWQQLQE